MNNLEKGDFYFGISDSKIYVCFFEKGKNKYSSIVEFEIPDSLMNDLNFRIIQNLLKENIRKIEKRLGLKSKIRANKYDLIITGEGCVDSQTKKGKLINHLGKIGHDLSTPIIVFCGSMKGRPNLKGIKSIEEISPDNIDLSTAIFKAPLFLERSIKKKIKKLFVSS